MLLKPTLISSMRLASRLLQRSFFLLLNVREQSDELLAECITSEAHANILATFNKHLQLLPLVCVQTQPCQSGVDSLRG